jgi:hypothetical protein
MYATTDSTTRSGSDQAPLPHASSLATRWARGRRRITPWAYPYLRALGAVRLTVGTFLVVLAAILIAHGYSPYAVLVLVGAALNLALGSLDTAAARTVHPRT